MLRFEVIPAELTGAAARQVVVSARMRDLAAQVDSAAMAAAGAAGEATLVGALSDWGTAWSHSMVQVAEAVGGYGQNLGAAGALYAATDAGAMPGTGP